MEQSRRMKVFEQNGFFVTAEFSGGEKSGAAQLRKPRFWGWSHEEPWNQTEQIRQRGQNFENCRRYVSRASSTHITGNVQRLRWSLTARIPSDPL